MESPQKRDNAPLNSPYCQIRSRPGVTPNSLRFLSSVSGQSRFAFCEITRLGSFFQRLQCNVDPWEIRGHCCISTEWQSFGGAANTKGSYTNNLEFPVTFATLNERSSAVTLEMRPSLRIDSNAMR